MKNKVLIVFCLIFLPDRIALNPFKKDQQAGEYQTWDTQVQQRIPKAHSQNYDFKTNLPHPKQQNYFENDNNYYYPRLYPPKYSSEESIPNNYEIQPSSANTFLDNKNEFKVSKEPYKTRGLSLGVHPSSYRNVFSRQNNKAAPIPNVNPTVNFRKPLHNDEPSIIYGCNNVIQSSPKIKSKSSHQGFTVLHSNGTVESFKKLDDIAKIYPNYMLIDEKNVDVKNIPISFFDKQRHPKNQNYLSTDLIFNDEKNHNIHKNNVNANSNINSFVSIADSRPDPEKFVTLKEKAIIPKNNILVKENSLNLNSSLLAKINKAHNCATFSDKNESNFDDKKSYNLEKNNIKQDKVLAASVPTQKTKVKTYVSPNFISTYSTVAGNTNFNNNFDTKTKTNSDEEEKVNKTAISDFIVSPDNYTYSVKINGTEEYDSTFKTNRPNYSILNKNIIIVNSENYEKKSCNNKTEEKTVEVHVNNEISDNNYESHSLSKEERNEIDLSPEKKSDSAPLPNDVQVLHSTNNDSDKPNVMRLENLHDTVSLPNSKPKIDHLQSISQNQIKPLLVQDPIKSTLDLTYSSKEEIINSPDALENKNLFIDYSNSDKIFEKDVVPDNDISTFNTINLSCRDKVLNKSESMTDDKQDTIKSFTSEIENINNEKDCNEKHELSAANNKLNFKSDENRKFIDSSTVKNFNSAPITTDIEGLNKSNTINNKQHVPVPLENSSFTPFPVITRELGDNSEKIKLRTVANISETDFSNGNHEENIILVSKIKPADTKSLLIPIVTPELPIDSDENEIYLTLSNATEMNLKHIPNDQLNSNIYSENNLQNTNSTPELNYESSIENQTLSTNDNEFIKTNDKIKPVFSENITSSTPETNSSDVESMLWNNKENSKQIPGISDTIKKTENHYFLPHLITNISTSNHNVTYNQQSHPEEEKKDQLKNPLDCNSTLINDNKDNSILPNDNAEADATVLLNNDEDMIYDSDSDDDNESQREDKEYHRIFLKNKKNELLRLLFGEEMDADSVFIFQIQGQPLTRRSIKTTIFPNGTTVEEITETV